MREQRRRTPLPATAAALLLLAAPAAAQDAAVRIDESTLDELAARIEPLTAEGRSVIEFLGIVICGDWEIEVDNLDFDVRASGSQLSADVDARYNCVGNWLTATSNISANVLISYQQAQRQLRVTTVAGPLLPFVQVPGWVPVVGGINLPIPFAVSVTPSMSFTLPIGTALLHFETVGGPRLLRATPENVALTVGDGFLELESDVTLW